MNYSTLENMRKRQQNIATLTKGGKSLTELFIPDHLIIPVVIKIEQSDSLCVDANKTNTYLLKLNKAPLKEDKESLSRYPKNWLDACKISQFDIIPVQALLSLMLIL